MKILVHNNNICSFGLANAANHLGHEVVLWSHENKSAFDVFHEFEPDLFICTSNSVNQRAISKNLNNREKLKCLVIDRPENAYRFDNILYSRGKHNPIFETDVSYMGKFSDWKLAFINPLIQAGYKVKIFSTDPWPIPHCVGAINVPDIPDAYYSSKVCLNLSETSDESFYRILGCGGIPCSNYVEGRCSVAQNCGPNPASFLEAAKRVVEMKEDDRQKYVDDAVSLINEQYSYVKFLKENLPHD